ncbi:type II toxin-antitoxin system PemK/MazF family toxin [Endozoicomonas arenosclerae]|uniref:type II toxin-antitoxin system PemK/MazF family toxin n=1 Tax=Endozoicomonas arenosclerae TaxID=1633495 RepID=UPI000780F49D|nr:type II toxin-antitoxin system PemK/MazF family toxin [Endozoicomonas arenosclerae]
MKRGDVVSVAIQGDYGKPRPALILQSDLFDQHPSLTLLPITSEIRDTPLFRYNLYQDNENGLNKPSQVMIDKITTIKVDKIGSHIGQISPRQMTEITRLVALWLGIA